MMAQRTLAVVVMAGVLSSCAPVPPYPVEPYVGSLDKCLDIQGTYENSNFYRKKNDNILIYDVLPERLGKQFGKQVKEKKFEFTTFLEAKKIYSYAKIWITIRFLDAQRLSIVVFNALGQEADFIVDMKNLNESGGQWGKEENFTCGMKSFQKSYVTTSSADGTRRKWRDFVEIAKVSGEMIKKERKADYWSGVFGLYYPLHPSSGEGDYLNAESVGYYRKVDLTVEDIRANNDKAKKAIAQYDEISTNPPPAN